MSELASAEQIERIVREVVQRLRGDAPTAAHRPTECVADNRTLVLTDAVVTLAGVRKRAGGVTRIVVQPKAVVTPAVAEELRWKGIELIRAEAAMAAKTPVLLLENDPRTALAQAGPVLARYGFQVEFHRASDDLRAVEMIQAFVKNGGAAIAVSRKPHWLAAELNRDSAARAAAITFGVDSLRAIDETQANCLAVERAAAGSAQLAVMARAMCTRGG